MKKINLFSALLFICYSGFAQKKTGETIYDQIRKDLVAHLNDEALKDSIALYTFAFRIEVIKTKDSTLVKSITVNDNIANVILPDYNFLRKENYAMFMSKAKRATLIIPFGLIVANYSQKIISDKNISIVNLANSINKMFNYDQKEDTNTAHFIYLKPIIVSLDKAVYD